MALTRCFICVDLPREIIQEVERVQEELKKKNLFHGKFVEGENLHLTLKFLGEIDEEKIEEVKRKLSEIKFEKFMAYLGEFGVFSSDYIRIVWTHILGKKVEDLQRIVDEKISGLFEKEKRFMSHLTVARVKNVKDKKLLLQALKEIKVRNVGFEVNEFYLMKSELKPEGPEYSVLKEFRLGNPEN